MRVLLVTLTFLGLLAALAAPVSATVKNNWHVHDGGTAPTSRPVVFFPAILTGGNVSAYLADPAHCTDATDKSLVGPEGSALPGQQPPFVGMCQTSDQVIHLKVIPGSPAPAGWESILFGGTTWYYKITDR